MLHKPEIEQEETFIHSRDGDEVEVVCIIHSSPRSTVEWYKNGQLLDPEKAVISHRGNRHTLLIQKIGKNQRLLFYCFESLGIGKKRDTNRQNMEMAFSTRQLTRLSSLLWSVLFTIHQPENIILHQAISRKFSVPPGL